MTFYNHIESVRSIAIDLTNGRKWRGASDKAAVFDALDAARREYMRLSDENAKLRNDAELLRAMLSQERTEKRCYMADNAKLRELVQAARKCIHSGVSCYDCRIVAGGCTLESAMRELGVEH